ncbi:MAG: SDR family NAD(P)-dependent oxidoreductase, partial [Verrucomicrobiota bacterium]
MEGSQKQALVTGAGRGLGAGIAKHLASQGFALWIHYHSSDQGAREVAEEIQAAGGQAEIVGADLSQESQVLDLIKVIEEGGRGLDVLVNNSGVYHEEAFLDLSESQWMQEIHSTATAVYFTTRAVLPMLR